MSSLEIKKVYIDTKYMTSDSQSTSNFKYQLARTIDLPDKCQFFINNVTIPHSWYTIEKGLNDKLYMYVAPKTLTPDMSGVSWATITVSPGIYNPVELATELQNSINNTIVSTIRPSMFRVTYNSRSNTINITTGYTDINFKILTPIDLKTKMNGTWMGASYDVNYPHDCNELISNLESATYDSFTPFFGLCNLQPIRNIYIHSSTLGAFQTLGVQGESTCIKKVPVNADVGMYIFYDEFLLSDVLDCSKQSFSVLEFQLRDSRGNLVNLHNNNVSFSICFVEQN